MEISQKYWEKPLANQLFFGLTFEPETLETKSRALKTRILAYNPKILRAKILARGIGWWHHIINQKSYPQHDLIGPKPPIQILKNFFLFWTTQRH